MLFFAFSVVDKDNRKENTKKPRNRITDNEYRLHNKDTIRKVPKEGLTLLHKAVSVSPLFS